MIFDKVCPFVQKGVGETGCFPVKESSPEIARGAGNREGSRERSEEWGYSAILIEHVIKAGLTIKK